MSVPGDETAAPTGTHGHLRASRADREQVIDVLKAAFVQERLTREEFDLRVGRVLASRTYAELAAVTADIPAGLIADQPPAGPAPVRAGARPPMGNAAKAGICVVIAVAVAAVMTVATNGYALTLFVPFYFMALLAAGAQMLASRHEKRSRGQLPPRPSPGTGAPHRPASAKAEQPPQIDHAQRRTDMETRRRLPHLSLPGLRPPGGERSLVRRYAVACDPGH